MKFRIQYTRKTILEEEVEAESLEEAEELAQRKCEAPPNDAYSNAINSG